MSRGDEHAELFDLHEDSDELHNLAVDPRLRRAAGRGHSTLPSPGETLPESTGLSIRRIVGAPSQRELQCRPDSVLASIAEHVLDVQSRACLGHIGPRPLAFLSEAHLFACATLEEGPGGIVGRSWTLGLVRAVAAGRRRGSGAPPSRPVELRYDDLTRGRACRSATTTISSPTSATRRR